MDDLDASLSSAEKERLYREHAEHFLATNVKSTRPTRTENPSSPKRKNYVISRDEKTTPSFESEAVPRSEACLGGAETEECIGEKFSQVFEEQISDQIPTRYRTRCATRCGIRSGIGSRPDFFPSIGSPPD